MHVSPLEGGVNAGSEGYRDMKTLLLLLGIILIAAGVAVGMLNVFSPGTVTVGLNLDVAATLFTGGCVLLGLSLVAGNLSDLLTQRDTGSTRHNDAPDARANSDLPDFMAPAGAAAAGAVVAGTARGAFGKTHDHALDDAADAVTQSVSNTMDATVDAAEEATSGDDNFQDDLSSLFDKAPDANDALGAPIDTASDTASDLISDLDDAGDAVAEAAEEAASEVMSDLDDAGDAVAEMAEDAADAVSEAAEDTSDAAEDAVEAIADDAADEAGGETLPQEDALFVVEERTIRKRPARLLSDGTVEAETDEGWMRFENVEHVEEYLDAMKATA